MLSLWRIAKKFGFHRNENTFDIQEALVIRGKNISAKYRK
jgi:hypothetical protein